MQVILVIDDEPGIRTTVRDILQDERYRVIVAEDALVGLDILGRERVDLVLLDVWLPRMGGLEALAEMKRLHPALEVVVFSGHASIDMAVRAVKAGAFDFIEKPLSIDRLLTVCRNALSLGELRKENHRLRRQTEGFEEMIGSSAPMEEVRVLCAQAAGSDARVLISGENGTGKELAARLIHSLSPRAEAAFVAVNCAAIPDSLLESELFGHERGAFTDAVSRRKGRFEAADGGTIFLDEVADLSPSAQAKLLRVLQETRFERLGGEETITVDVRVIAASNKDMRAEVAAGRFREDLYFRLAVLPIYMPALRERRDDIPVLCAHFLGSTEHAISPEAMDLLSGRNWPGNIRELRNAMERLRVLSDSPLIGPEEVTRILGGEAQPRNREGTSFPESWLALNLAEAREKFEKEYLLHKLRNCGYNVARTAESIGVYPSSLHARIKKLGIELEK
jgi:two-component system nitrogen regulation response regulator NtrX